jgi:ABC-2 type transport system permease protein
MNMKFYFNVCKNLIAADLTIFKQAFFGKFIDLSIWVILTVVVTSYIMPYFGLSHDFGPFQVAGVIAAAGLFELYANVVDLVADFEGDRVINYNLTLPIPSWLAIVSKATYYFIIYLILALLMLPIGKIALWNQLDLTQINYFKFAVALIFQSIFYACFVLWASSIIANMTQMSNVWSRFVFPMWFMGGFQFSWMALYHVIPIIAYISLINPMIYITEAVRAAMLGQSGYINFWISLLLIALFSGISFALGYRNLKKRLDFV